MRAGTLNRKITIQSKGTPARNAYGEEVITWQTVATPRASITPLRGKERIEAAQVSAEVTHRIRIRYRGTSITPEMRVLYSDPVEGNRVLGIVSVVNVSTRNREIELMCEEQVDV